jgi:hypothetical protein
MAAIFSNSLGLFNVTTKSTPLTADLLALGDSAVTGVPMKQCTVGSLPFAALNNSVNVVTATQQMVINTRYYVDYTGGTCTLTLPTAVSSILGSTVRIRGGNANTVPYVIGLNTNQIISVLGSVTSTGPTSGATATLTSASKYDSMTIECMDTSAGLLWMVTELTSLGSVELQ